MAGGQESGALQCLHDEEGHCSGQKMPDSYGHLSEALGNLGSGNLEGGGLGKG